ncbi:hypothetical protein HUU42_07455 [bacterium]|nr:hypothetical protein [bacterium]
MRVFLAILALTLFACDKNDESDKQVALSGTVKFIALEGGFYGIEGDDGVHYDPIDFDERFKQDGLRVRVKGRIDPSIGTIHMWGYSLIITHIEEETWPVDFY